MTNKQNTTSNLLSSSDKKKSSCFQKVFGFALISLFILAAGGLVAHAILKPGQKPEQTKKPGITCEYVTNVCVIEEYPGAPAQPWGESLP